MRRIPILSSFTLFAALGCASLKPVAEEARRGVPPNLAVITEGKGWSCYVASKIAWSGCWRTPEQCAEEQEKNKKAAADTGEKDLQFGPCQPAPRASCLTYEELQPQPDGTAKPVPSADCMPDLRSCESFGETLRQRTNTSSISSCVGVD